MHTYNLYIHRTREEEGATMSKDTFLPDYLDVIETRLFSPDLFGFLVLVLVLVF